MSETEVLDKDFLSSIPDDVFEIVWQKLEKYDINDIDALINIFPTLGEKIDSSVRRVDLKSIDSDIIDICIYRFPYLKEINVSDVNFDDIESVEALLSKYPKIKSVTNIRLSLFNDDTVFSILRLIRNKIETIGKDFKLDFYNTSIIEGNDAELHKRIMYADDAFLFDVQQFQLDYIVMFIRIIQPRILITYSDSRAEEFVGCKSISKIHVIGRSDYNDDYITPLNVKSMLNNNHEYLSSKGLLSDINEDRGTNSAGLPVSYLRTGIKEITFEAETTYKFDYGILDLYNGTENGDETLHQFIDVIRFDVPIRISQVPFFVDTLPRVKKYNIIYRKEESLDSLNLYPDIEFDVHEFNPDPEGNNYGIEINDGESESDNDSEAEEIYDIVVNNRFGESDGDNELD